MLQSVITIILVVIALFTFSLFLQKYKFIPPHLKEDFQKVIAHYNVLPKSYKNATLGDLVEELRNMCIESQFEGLNELVNAIKDRAEFVIVGTVKSFSGQQQSSGSSDYEATLYFNIYVDSVERGNYPYDTIQVYAGYYANWLPIFFYPMGIKWKYNKGDRLRVYVNYNLDTGEYVASAGFFSMDPLPPNN
jgi:hypothetical protein